MLNCSHKQEATGVAVVPDIDLAKSTLQTNAGRKISMTVYCFVMLSEVKNVFVGTNFVTFQNVKMPFSSVTILQSLIWDNKGMKIICYQQ